jgi:cytidyltransferase-like protein
MSKIKHPQIDHDYLILIKRQEPYRAIYLGGTFDCLHRGHLTLFLNAGRIATEVVVSVNTDEFATYYKRAPIQPLADRIAVLEACTLVDRVVINTGGHDSKPAIAAAAVDAIGHGSDWFGTSLMDQMGLTIEWLTERHIEMVSLPYTAGISSTDSLRRAKDILGTVEWGRM